MTITAFPLQWPDGWPRAELRVRAQFGKQTKVMRSQGPGLAMVHAYNEKKELTIGEATKRVLTELARLGISSDNLIVSTNLKLRLDGLPRSDQPMPKDPGAAVYWQADGQAMRVMAIDRYDRVADNLAAIAATLEAMRAIERHGGGQILERAFTGFTALPPPPDCWAVLGLDGSKKPDRLAIDAAYRRQAKKAHPDWGGSVDAMARLNQARADALKTCEVV